MYPASGQMLHNITDYFRLNSAHSALIWIVHHLGLRAVSVNHSGRYTLDSLPATTNTSSSKAEQVFETPQETKQ